MGDRICITGGAWRTAGLVAARRESIYVKGEAGTEAQEDLAKLAECDGRLSSP